MSSFSIPMGGYQSIDQHGYIIHSEHLIYAVFAGKKGDSPEFCKDVLYFQYVDKEYLVDMVELGEKHVKKEGDSKILENIGYELITGMSSVTIVQARFRNTMSESYHDFASTYFPRVDEFRIDGVLFRKV